MEHLDLYGTKLAIGKYLQILQIVTEIWGKNGTKFNPKSLRLFWWGINCIPGNAAIIYYSFPRVLRNFTSLAHSICLLETLKKIVLPSSW